jgi:ERCC4-type nuclease
MAGILDTRERELIRILGWPTRPLPVGDVWIGVDLSGNLNAGGIVAERKSVADLEASILDGRYREQRTRLLSHCQLNGYRPLYIIEGELDRLAGRLTKQALRKFLTRLTLRYSVAVLQTESTDDTAKLCLTLADQLKEDPKVFQSEEAAKVQYTDTISVHRKGNKDDPAIFASAVLQQCTGISAAGATAILAVYPTLSAVWAATEQQLATIVVGKRKLGLVVAQRLHTLLHGASLTTSGGL